MRTKPIKIPDVRTTELSIERYWLRIPDASFTMSFPGSSEGSPGYDPLRLVDAIVDGLQRSGFDVEIEEEYAKTVKKVFRA